MTKKYNFHLNIAKKRGDYVLFALPQTNQYQRIEELRFKEKPAEIIEDKKWGNKIVIFRLNDVVDLNSIRFYSSPSSINKSIAPALSLNHYVSQPYPNLTPDNFINGKDPKIVKLAKNQIFSEVSLDKIIKKLYFFTLEYLTYGKPIEGLYSYRQAMEEMTTDCGGFSTFLASLLQAVGIPSRLVIGYLIKENWYTKLLSSFDFCTLNFEFLKIHAWLEVLLPDKNWLPLDPSIEWRRKKGLTKREGGFGQVPADRLILSYGQEFTFNIDKKKFHVELLQHPIYL